jgi:hypothetical protein
VYLPGARGGDDVIVTAATGRRPAGAPVPISVSIGGTPVGRFEAGRDWAEHTLRLPDPLPPGPPVLRLDVPTFRPGKVWPDDPDTRDLGVMLDRIRLTIPVSRAAGGSP